jgi:hypothetical protein
MAVADKKLARVSHENEAPSKAATAGILGLMITSGFLFDAARKFAAATQPSATTQPVKSQKDGLEDTGTKYLAVGAATGAASLIGLTYSAGVSGHRKRIRRALVERESDRRRFGSVALSNYPKLQLPVLGWQCLLAGITILLSWNATCH